MFLFFKKFDPQRSYKQGSYIKKACIRQLREFYGYESIDIIFAKARKRFLVSIANHNNGLLRFLSKLVVE